MYLFLYHIKSFRCPNLWSILILSCHLFIFVSRDFHKDKPKNVIEQIVIVTKYWFYSPIKEDNENRGSPEGLSVHSNFMFFLEQWTQSLANHNRRLEIFYYIEEECDNIRQLFQPQKLIEEELSISFMSGLLCIVSSQIKQARS
jgi:hypothetical protein